MGITSSNKVVDRSEVSCDDEFQVTLALTAAPDIIENPTDLWCRRMCPWGQVSV